MKRFLWHYTNIECQPHLVTWDMVTKPVEEGNLVIRHMRDLNLASMAKLGYKIPNEQESLLARVLCYKYHKG